MNLANQKFIHTKRNLLERKRLTKTIRDWASENIKIFWKYELSCFYKTYTIRVTNLPKPSKEDITVSSYKLLLNNQQKTKLCNAIKKACGTIEDLSHSCIDVQINFKNGAVIAEAV